MLIMQRPTVSELVQLAHKGYGYFGAACYANYLEEFQELLQLVPLAAVETTEDAARVMSLVYHSRSAFF